MGEKAVKKCRQKYSPDSRLRIFLSYGHDANEDLVRRIKDDLANRGHHVWFDKSEIKFGDDWRRAITDGITDSSRVLSFLSKHATRDPGVCLDEIAIAIGVKGGNIQTILVEAESEVRPPASISHIQWLDMHDWKQGHGTVCLLPDTGVVGDPTWERWYKDRFAEIVRVVESDESRRFAGEIEALNTHLKPISSDSRIAVLLRKRFVGRTWLTDAVEEWRTASDRTSRLFWIVGDPGVGKSAFAAHLSHYGRDKVIAAQFVEWDKPDHRDARRVIRNLTFQLATRLPDYRKLLLTLPEIAELDRKDPAELFDYLLANPLRSAVHGRRQRYLIVIDALDEANEAERNPLVEMLAHNAPRLPDWVGLMVTSRPESAVKTPLQGLNPFILDARTEANRNDICDYLRYQLAPQLTGRPDTDRLIEQILEKSEGLFLYIERFCDDIQCNRLSLDHPDQFPQGLGGIFCQWFQRQFPDLEKFRKDVRPALRAILAAREPLPVEILQRLFHWQDEELRDFTRILGSLFPVTKEASGDVIKPYHRSLADWLEDDDKAAGYFVSLLEGHRLLADTFWNDFERQPDELSQYALRHLPTHLTAISRWRPLVGLLASEAFLADRERGSFVGQYPVLQDYSRAIASLPSELQQVLWHAPVRCALLALKGIGDLIDYGQSQLGKTLLWNCSESLLSRKEPELICHWHILAGTLATYEGNAADAVRLLSIAVKTAEDAGYQEGIARSLLAIAVELRVSDGSIVDAERLLREALERDFTKRNPNVLARVLLNLSMIHVRKGQADEADELLAKARLPIQESGNPILEAWLFKYKGFAARLRCDFPAAAQRFSLASELFLRLGSRQEAERCKELKNRTVLSKDADQLFAQASERVQELMGEAKRNGRAEKLEVNEAILKVFDALRSVDLSCATAQERVMAIMRGPLLWLEQLVGDPWPPMYAVAPQDSLKEPLSVRTRDGMVELVAPHQPVPLHVRCDLIVDIMSSSGIDVEFYYGDQAIGHILLTELPASVSKGTQVSLCVDIAEDLSLSAWVGMACHGVLGEMSSDLGNIIRQYSSNPMKPTRDELVKTLVETKQMLDSFVQTGRPRQSGELGGMLDRLSTEADQAYHAGDRQKWKDVTKRIMELRERLESHLRQSYLDQVPAPILRRIAFEWLERLNQTAQANRRAISMQLEEIRNKLKSVDVEALDAKQQIFQILQDSYFRLEALWSDPAPPSSCCIRLNE